MQISQIIYTDDLSLLQRESTIYRAFIFNKKLKLLWNSLFIKLLKKNEEGQQYLDYFLLSEEVSNNDDPLLKSFYTWLLNGGECPLYISDELDTAAKQYSVNCIKNSLQEIIGQL